MFRHPAAAAKWKTLEECGVSADVPTDALGIAGREALVRGMPVHRDGYASAINGLRFRDDTF